MAIPIVAAAGRTALHVGGSIAASKAFQGAAGAIGVSRIAKMGKWAGKRSVIVPSRKALKAAGVKKKARREIIGTMKQAKAPTTLAGQAANVATSIPGSAAIGAGSLAGYGHWKNQPRDSHGRWTR